MSQRSIGEPPAPSDSKLEASAQAVRSTGSAELYERRRPRKGSPKREAKADPTSSWERVVDRLFQNVEVKVRDRALPPAVVQNRQARAQRRIVDALSSRGAAALTAPIRKEVEVLVERWAAEGFRDGYSEVEAFEIRCAEEQERLEALSKGDQAGALEVELQAYRRRVIDHYGTIEIRGLQLSERVLQPLAVAYVPLFLEDRSIEKVVSRTKDFEVRELPRRPVQEALEDHGRLLIVGAPGSGKTTLVADLATRAAAGERVPFVIPVRSLLAATIDVATIAAVSWAEPALVEQALVEGRALILIDGLDEISPAELPSLRTSLERFVEAHPKAQVVVTSRPAAVDDEEPLAGFAPTRLLPMERSEVDDFIDKWCLAAEISILEDRALAEQQGRLAAEDLKRALRSSAVVERLAETPLLASILCVVHRSGQRLPARRTALYGACTNVLLHEWDRAKFRGWSAVGKLDAYQKQALLNDLAAWMHEKRVVEVTADEVTGRFAQQLLSLGMPAEEAKTIVLEIRDRGGLLMERRPNVFAFPHLAFQEYLTAHEYVRRHAYEDLVERRNEEWWHEVIVLAAGLPSCDSAQLVRRLLDADGQQIFEGTLLAAQCVEVAIDLPISLRREVESRLEKLASPAEEKGFLQWRKLGRLGCFVLWGRFDRAPGVVRAWTARVFRHHNYVETCGFLARQLADHSTMIDGKFTTYLDELGLLVLGPPFQRLSLTSFLTYLLFDWSARSELAFISLKGMWADVEASTKGIIKLWAETSINPELMAAARRLIDAVEPKKPPRAGRRETAKPKADTSSG